MNLDDVFVLNSDYQFKYDIDRVAIYSKKDIENNSSKEWLSYIHPSQALILDLFTQPITMREHVNTLSTHFKISHDKVVRIISDFVENETSVYTEFSGVKIPFPKNVLIRDENYDFSFQSKRWKIGKMKFHKIDLTQDRMHKSPHSLVFMLTKKCLTKCEYCYANTMQKCSELGTKEIVSIINEAKRLDISYIDVIGGEIFCKKDWNIILHSLIECNLSPNYISTKVPITKEIAKSLYKTGYKNLIQISLDSIDESVLAKIINCKQGYVKKIKEGIDLLQEYGFKIQINTVLTKYNSDIGGLKKMYDYIKSITNLVYWEIRVPEKSIYSPLSFSMIKADKKTLQNACNYVRENIISDSYIRIIVNDDALDDGYCEGKCTDSHFKEGHCGALKSSLFILPDGKVSICELLYWHPQFIVGDLREQSLEEIWKSDKAISLFNQKRGYCRDESFCSHCKSFDFCNKNHRKCWIKIIRAYGSENWDYPDPRCEYAPKTKLDITYT